MLAKLKRLPRNIIARQIGIYAPTNDVAVEKRRLIGGSFVAMGMKLI